MSYAAQVAIAADRYTPCVRTITLRGLDLTGVALRMQWRLRADTPGVPLVDLQNVANAQAQGLKLVSVDLTGGYPISVVQMRVNETTIEGLPYSGELGDATTLEYDLQGTLGGDKRVLMAGSVTIGAGVTGADNAPLNRPFGYNASATAGGMRSGATLTFGETRVDITIDGADLIAPLTKRATDAATAAEGSAAVAGLARDMSLAASSYYPTRAAGEAASANNAFFATDDGAGALIAYRKTASGSVEIGRFATKVAIDSLVTGLAAGTQMVGGSLPGFPGIVKSLGDALPYISPSEFFGVKSDGVSDDTLALQLAIDAVTNNSRSRGGMLQLRPRGLTKTSAQIILKPYVRLDLRGGTLQPNLNGGNDAGIRPMSNSEIAYGMIDVRSTGTPGSQASVHASIFIGAAYGGQGTGGGTIANPSAYDNVTNVHIHHLSLISDKDLGPIATGGASALHVIGNVSGCTIEQITVLASSKMQAGVVMDWGIRGEESNGAQGIFSSPAAMARNRQNFDNGIAFTTHPHDNIFRDITVQALTRPLQAGVVDSGTYAARVSGGHGNTFERIHAEATSEASFVSHIGDLAYEYSKGDDLARAFLGNVFRDCSVADAGAGVGIKSDSDGDNVRRAQTDFGYTPRFASTWRTDTLFERVVARTAAGGSTEQSGVYCFRQIGGTFRGCDMRGFGIGARYVGVIDVLDEGARYTFSRRQNVSLENASTVEFIRPAELAYANRAGGNYSNVDFSGSAKASIRGGHIGANASDESSKHAIKLAAAADGSTETTLEGVTINSHGAGSFAVVAGGGQSWGTLALISDMRYGSFVSNRYSGQEVIPVGRRQRSDGSYKVTYNALSGANLTGLNVAPGDRVEYDNPAAGGRLGLVCVTAGMATATGVMKPFGPVDA